MEYAIEAINNAGTCVGILASDGIVMASEKRISSGLLAPSTLSKNSSDKTFPLARHVAANVAGLFADANLLMEQARLRAGRYNYQYQQDIPVEQLVEYVCDYKQYYTQFGGMRPFGVAFLFAGYDTLHGFQLYQSDPSGNYSGWKATVIGANNQAGKSILKTEYQKDEGGSSSSSTGGGESSGTTTTTTIPTVQEALKLAVKVLQKTMDGTGGAVAASEKMELFTMTLDPVTTTKTTTKTTTTGGTMEEREEDDDTPQPPTLKHEILTKEQTQAIITAVEQETAAAGDS